MRHAHGFKNFENSKDYEVTIISIIILSCLSLHKTEILGYQFENLPDESIFLKNIFIYIY